MANRYRDTAIWKKAWFRTLTPTMKCVWDFLCDNCDHAGFWDIDEASLAHYVGEAVSVDQIRAVFGDKIQQIDDKLWLTKFIEFQYRCSISELNPKNKVHLSVIRLLNKQGARQGLPSTFQGAIEIDKAIAIEIEEGESEGKQKIPGPFQSAKELQSSLPLIDQQKIKRDYPDPVWVARQIELCFDHFAAEPKETPRTAGKWSQKVRSWLESSWEKAKQARSNKPRIVPETGGYGEIDGVK